MSDERRPVMGVVVTAAGSSSSGTVEGFPGDGWTLKLPEHHDSVAYRKAVDKEQRELDQLRKDRDELLEALERCVAEARTRIATQWGWAASDEFAADYLALIARVKAGK